MPMINLGPAIIENRTLSQKPSEEFPSFSLFFCKYSATCLLFRSLLSSFIAAALPDPD